MSPTPKRGPPHDPDLLIAQALEMGDAFAGPAEDILFSWLISLGQEVEPALAAGKLLDEHKLRHGPVPDGAVGRLWTLLRETALYPDIRLRSTSSRRTGRRRARH
jgi:hypothetical protein